MVNLTPWRRTKESSGSPDESHDREQASQELQQEQKQTLAELRELVTKNGFLAPMEEAIMKYNRAVQWYNRDDSKQKAKEAMDEIKSRAPDIFKSSDDPLGCVGALDKALDGTQPFVKGNFVEEVGELVRVGMTVEEETEDTHEKTSVVLAE